MAACLDLCFQLECLVRIQRVLEILKDKERLSSVRNFNVQNQFRTLKMLNQGSSMQSL